MEAPEDVLFSASVKAEQERLGSRKSFRDREWATEVTENLAQFLDAIDTFFLATASADGRPYVQHRGGPPGFLKPLNGKTLVLTYNEALDAIHIPPASAFSVAVDGTPQAAPTGVAVNSAARTVTLTLAAPVTMAVFPFRVIMRQCVFELRQMDWARVEGAPQPRGSSFQRGPHCPVVSGSHQRSESSVSCARVRPRLRADAGGRS